MIRRKVPWLLPIWRTLQGLPLRLHSPERIFSRFYQRNRWGDLSSRSGEGSNLEQTAVIRRELPKLADRYRWSSLLDAPCGDFHWLSQVELELDYTGCDIVQALIQMNKRAYAGPRRRFLTCNIITDRLPKADVVLCRDCLVHLSYADIERALVNLKASGAEHLLTTTFRDRTRNWNIVTGSWRPINLRLPPFNFPVPLEVIDEACPVEEGDFADKCLALWRFADLPVS